MHGIEQENVSQTLHFLLIISPMLLLGNSAKVIGYGHLGDGNLHLNISTPQYDDMVSSFGILQKVALAFCSTWSYIDITNQLQILAQIEPFVYEWTSKHRGSISAEHGLGLMKANEIFYSKSHRSVRVL